MAAANVKYHPPVDYQITLAGNFGEPRPNHFHGGLDVKTDNVEGKHIYTIGDGYVSRLTVGIDGFGNAVYQSPHPRPAEALPSESVTVYVDLKRSREAAQDLRDLTWMKQTGEISEDTYEEIKSKLLRQL